MKRFFCVVVLSVVAICSVCAQGYYSFVSPEVKGDKVTFKIDANYATVVTIFGSWMDERSNPLPLKKGRDGIWEITIDTPEPEIYTYYYYIDGVKVNDPHNSYVQRDGRSYFNMLFVDGPRSNVYFEARKRGTVSEVWYDSSILACNRRLTVYTPYGYETGLLKFKKYPVLYLLHGSGGDEQAWLDMGRAAQILDNLIERGEVEPMIVVMPNGNSSQQAASIMGIPGTGKADDNKDFVRTLISEIIPYIEKNYKAQTSPSSRAIAGFSMGGSQTILASQMYPAKFDYICPMSIGLDDTPDLRAGFNSLTKDGYKLFWCGIGQYDFMYEKAYNMDKIMTDMGFKHTFYVSDGGHEWKNWRLYLQTMLPLLFK